jgi:uncharacterized protein YdcH (DUF465 family)
MMHVENHPSLANEFPEFKEKIHTLKIDNAHFAKLFEEYNHLDREIIRIEEGVEHAGDFDLETLKKKRLGLKDELYRMLVAA